MRPIWRFFLSAAMVFFIYVFISLLVGGVFRKAGFDPQAQFFHFFLCMNLVLLPALLFLFKMMSDLFEGKPLAAVGLAFRGRWRMELALGLGLGAAMIYLVAALERALGLASFGWGEVSPGRALAGGAFLFLLLAVAATNEELTFRGYPFQRLVDCLGPAGAVAVSSALFGLVHLGNPARTWVSTLNTMLVGVPLAVAYLRTRALWMPIGMHFAWNFLQSYGLGLPVSGIILPDRLVRAEVHGQEWLTGGAYGPEGGLLATLSIAAGTLYLIRARSIYVSEEMQALVFGPSASSGQSLT